LRRDHRAIALCPALPHAHRIATEEGLTVEQASLHVIPDSGRTCHSNDLVEVVLFNNSRLYVEAPNIGSALATVALRNLAAPESIALTRFYFARWQQNGLPCLLDFDEERAVSPLTRCLLPLVNNEYFRLFAHAINTANDFETEEALRQHEVNAHTYPSVNRPPYKGLSGWTASDIRKDTDHLWSYLFWESAGADLEQMRFHAACKETENAMELLVYAYLLSYWGGYDCRFPHTLYRLLLANSLFPYRKTIEKFDQVF